MKTAITLITLLAVSVVAFSALDSRADAASVIAFNTNHDCAFCHNLHGAAGGQLLDNAVTESLCLSCHGPSGPSSLKADTHEGRTCTDCHVSHDDPTNWLGGTNIKLVRDSVLNSDSTAMRPVVFESVGDDSGGCPRTTARGTP